MAAKSTGTPAHPVPDYILAIVGMGVVAWLLYTLPILDILSVFFTFFVIPVLFIGCLAMGSMGTFNSISRGWNSGMEQVKERVAQKVAKAS
mgnify:FL=1|tara:strand:- start:538 stop:810 length:273 start_codon:yes stop_codon:yes gene_type:complete